MPDERGVVEKRPNVETLEELARDACLAWADGDNDAMQCALLALFLHLYGRAPALYVCTKCGWSGPESEAVGPTPGAGGRIERMIWCPRCPYQVIAILDRSVSSREADHGG